MKISKNGEYSFKRNTFSFQTDRFHLKPDIKSFQSMKAGGKYFFCHNISPVHLK